MIFRLGLAATVALFAAASSASTGEQRNGRRDAPKPRPVSIQPIGVRGDTVLFTARSQRHPQATGIEWCVRAWQFSLTGWTGLPCTVISPSDTIRVVASNTAWDSVRFRVVAWSRRNAERSRDSVQAISPTFKRALPPPGPIVIDTTTQVLAIDLRPDSVPNLPVGGTQQFCVFQIFTDQRVAMRRQDSPACDSLYVVSFPVSRRGVSLAQQAKADSGCIAWRVEPASGGTVTADACGALGAELQRNRLRQVRALR